MNQQERKEALDGLLAKWGVQRGQVWRLVGHSEHWAVCGDSREATKQVSATLGWPWPVVGVFTSPPYLGQRAYEGGERLTQVTWDALLWNVAASVLPLLQQEAQVFINLGPVHQ